MILWLRLELAYWLDLLEHKVRRLGEKWGWPQAWFQEFQTYLAQPRMELWEFYVRYTLLRMDAEAKWFGNPMTAPEAERFYEKHDYMLWRNLVHRRHSAWRRVLATMRGPHGHFLEFGCGVAPVASYALRRGTQWATCAYDLEGPALKFARWRGAIQCAVPHASYDVITAVDVCEHLPDPESTMRMLVAHLKHGGYLHFNIHRNPTANDLDLATEAQLDATEKYLQSALVTVWRKANYCVGRKP